MNLPAFNPAKHPRGPNGRFTRSFSRLATAAQKSRGEKAMAGFKPSKVDAGFLGRFAADKNGAAFGNLGGLNATLRAGKSGPEVDAARSALKPLPGDVLLSRTVPLAAFGSVKPDALRGFTVRDAGFFPATTNTPSPSSGNVLLRIQAPAGTPAVANPNSGEVVLGDGLDMLVHGVRTTDAGTEMALTVLPPDGASTPDAPSDTQPSADTPNTSTPSPTVPTEPLRVGNIIDGNALAGADSTTLEQIRSQYADAFNGTYGNLAVEVNAVEQYGGGWDGESPGAIVRLTIRDANGNQVGTADRAVYRDDNGDLAAVHEMLLLDEGVRGGGFAAAFNQHLERWYRDQDVGRIELTANVDVGGYAWASNGYNFQGPISAQAITTRLRQQVDAYRTQAEQRRGDGDTSGAQMLDGQVRQAEDLLARASQNRFGTPDFPTPFEISQVGRPEGLSSRQAVDTGQSWLGRDTMLGSSWEGVRWL